MIKLVPEYDVQGRFKGFKYTPEYVSLLHEKELDEKIQGIETLLSKLPLLFAEFEVKLQRIETKLDEKLQEVGPQGLPGKDGNSIQGLPGKDANESLIVEKILSRIKVPQDGKNGLSVQGPPGPRGASGRDGKDISTETIDKFWSELDLIRKKLTNKTIQPVLKGGGGISKRNLKSNVIPTGTLNGVNKIFTLPDVPFTGTLKVYSDGQRMNKDIASPDFTLSVRTITFTSAPISSVLCDYQV